ncbi:TatD family hydrolase [Marinospirillum perlucidum]|uniref:TatD family hydrolase n=1 Tax=Marinospirillum perlucidum TaxID=1982602 RepID=UPI000DF3C87F|nr:TatD family hydrolase [Marinospirillum perlucidum]
MLLTDAHCHLDFPDFEKDREAMLERARKAGIKRFVLPGTTAATWQHTLDLAASHDDLHPCLGLHPYFMQEHQGDQLSHLDELLEAHSEVVAVGEIGIDFWEKPSQEERDKQWALLDAQLKLAKKHRLPAVLHIRKAMDSVSKRLRQLDLPRGGLAHAFSGSPQQARKLVDLGFKLGLGGAITYPRAKKLHEVVRQLPVSAFLLETDSPDMPVCGYQGQRNEPARITKVFQAFCDLRQESPQKLADQLEENLHQLFYFP